MAKQLLSSSSQQGELIELSSRAGARPLIESSTASEAHDFFSEEEPLTLDDYLDTGRVHTSLATETVIVTTGKSLQTLEGKSNF
jgi:hypothetical protein